MFKSQERNWRTHYNFICEPGREETVGGALIGIGASQKISFGQVEEQFKGLITFDAIGAIHTLPDVSLMRPFQPPAPFGGLYFTQLNFLQQVKLPDVRFSKCTRNTAGVIFKMNISE